MAEYRIDKKIVRYEIVKPEKEQPPKEKPIEQMGEHIERPPYLEGYTYKIKSPLFEHAIYVTINDIVLNPGTPHEQRRPFEIFINSKNMEHFQWIVALTRIISAVFRKGGDVHFLVDELRSVFDPRGGYFKPGGRYMASIIAEIGDIIGQHLERIGLSPNVSASPSQAVKSVHASPTTSTTTPVQKPFSPETSAHAKSNGKSNGLSNGKGNGHDLDHTPSNAPESLSKMMSFCSKCNQPSVVHSEGCSQCLSCGYSRCL